MYLISGLLSVGRLISSGRDDSVKIEKSLENVMLLSILTEVFLHH